MFFPPERDCVQEGRGSVATETKKRMVSTQFGMACFRSLPNGNRSFFVTVRWPLKRFTNCRNLSKGGTGQLACPTLVARL